MCNSQRMRALWPLIFSAVACSSPAPASSDEPVDAAAPVATDDASAALPAPGTYSVPVSDPALTAVASFAVVIKVQTTRTGPILHYDLPVGLVGVPFQNVKVDLSGATPQLLVGKNVGAATCNQTNTVTTCSEHLPAIQVDLALVRAQAMADGLLASAIDQRVAVATSFSIDPIGILAVDLGSSSSGGNGGMHGNPGKP